MKQPSRPQGEHCRNLLYALLVMLVVAPLLRSTRIIDAIELALFILVLITAMRAFARHSADRVITIVLSVPLVVVGVGSVLTPESADTSLAAGASATLFVAFVAVRILKRVLTEPLAVRDRLDASGAVFLLLAVAWSGVYAAIELIAPFSFTDASAPEVRVTWGDLHYYSLVTITTLGYGDITPETPPARSMAGLAAAMGLFYFAVVVARFVSAETLETDQQPRSSPDEENHGRAGCGDRRGRGS